MAWLLFRFVGFIQAQLFEILGLLNPPKNLNDKAEWIGRVYGGWYIFGAKDRRTVPEIVQKQGLMAGKLILIVIIVSLIQALLKKII